MFKVLAPVLHSKLRLAIVSLLISVEEAEFTYLKEKTNASSGNLSVQLDKLKTEGYIEINKSFRNNYPLTVCKITSKGINAFEKYVESLKSYLNPKK